MTEYIKNPLSGKLRGVTYEDGKIIDVHIRDTDDVVKVFVPVRHGRWENCFEDWRHQIEGSKCSACGFEYYGTGISRFRYCPSCGAKMDEEERT